MEHLSQQLRSTADPLQEARRLARVYKVSSLVLLRRLRDLGSMDEITYWKSFRQELKRLEALGRPSSGGGNYFANQTSRLGQQFTRTLVLSALEGQTLYRDAFRLLGVRKMETFQKLAAHVGVPV